MANNMKIKYGVYPNPLPDKKGNKTYQVRHEPIGTVDTEAFVEHLEFHNNFSASFMKPALVTLVNEIVEQLQNNKRFRINGLGTFQMKVGLKQKKDEEGNSIKQVITNPQSITSHDVEVTGVSFIPDKNFIRKLTTGVSTEKSSQRGMVGRSQQYERQEIVNFLNTYLAENHFITRRTFRMLLGLTNYQAQKWLDTLCHEEYPKYVAQKEGTTIVYRRFGQN